jgi:hypothetical protein
MLTTDARRDAADRDDFYEPGLQFGIRRPQGWRFLPASWSPAEQLGRVSSKADWARHARLPFVAMVRDIRSNRHPRPTIQVTCRPASRHTAAEIRKLLEAQLDFLSRELDEFERLTSSFDNIIGGYRAAHVQFRYTLNVPCDGTSWPMRVLAHNYLVPTPGLAFTVAMSSSVDALYYDEGDFAAALSSIRIGSPDETLPGPTLDRPRVIGWTGARSRPASS